MTSIFEGFSSSEVDRIKAAGRETTLPEGWSPIAEKTGSDKAYIILEGEVSVRRSGEEIARLGPGEIIGEHGIVHHSLRSASIVALTRLRLIHYTAEALERLVTEMPAFREAVERAAAERLDRG